MAFLASSWAAERGWGPAWGWEWVWASVDQAALAASVDRAAVVLVVARLWAEARPRAADHCPVRLGRSSAMVQTFSVRRLVTYLTVAGSGAIFSRLGFPLYATVLSAVCLGILASALWQVVANWRGRRT